MLIHPTQSSNGVLDWVVTNIKRVMVANLCDVLMIIKMLRRLVLASAFNDAEAQGIIDVLLTKQSGDMLNTSEDWIEKGKPTESQKL